MFFRTAYSPAEVPESNSGTEVYEWSYYADNGELVAEKRNFRELIQSSRGITDYKELIRNGFFEQSMDESDGGIYCDTTQYGTSVDTYAERIRALSQELEMAVNAIKQGQAVTGAGEKSAKSAEKTSEVN